MKEHNAIKSHKKLYKSGKTWMAATLLTVGLAGGAALTGTTNVHADEVTPAQATGTIQAGQQATDPELANSQSDAQKQQATIDSANAQLKDQQAQLSDAQGQQSQAQQELDQAKQAQQAATQNDPAVKQAQADVNQAQQQVDNQQQVVNDAQTVVNNDAQNVQSASDAVNQAKQDATNAINKAAEQKTSEAQNTINNLENQGKTQASQNLDNQINNVSGQVTNAQNDVNNTNSKIGDLQNQVKDLQDQEKNTQTDPNIATVPNGVIDTSKSLLENVARNNLWDPYVSQPGNGNIIPQDLPITADNDKGNLNTKNVDPTNAVMTEESYNAYFNPDFDPINTQTGMTDAQKQELAILMLNEINGIRKQRGLKPFVMTEQKYQQAQVRASQQSAQGLEHNVNDMVSAFGQDQYENLAYIPVNTPNANNMVNMLLTQANTTLSSMLNADASSDWGHRENFLEDTGTLSANAAFGFHLTDDGQYYVLTFDYDLSNPDSTPNMMDRIAQYQAMGPITGDSHVVDNSAKINDLNNQISNLQNTLASQQSHLSDLQTQLQNLQAQKANVQFDLSQLNADQQAEYSQAKETLNTVNDWKNDQLTHLDSNTNVKEAQGKLANAQATKTADEANLKQAKDGLAQLNQVLATKQAALQTAKDNANTSANQAVKDAQAKLDAINGKIDSLNKAIEATKTTIQNAQTQLDKDNQKIADIKNGQKPVDPNKGSDKPTNPTTPTNPSKPNTGKDDNNKGNQPTNPTTPTKPDDGKKDDNKGDKPVTPTNPTKPDNGNSQPTTPTTPTTPAQSDHGNASISGQAGHKPGQVVDNGNQTTDSTANKPTIVLLTKGSQSNTNTQGQYINIISKDSVASQAGIQAPAAPETTSVTFGTKKGTLMTREQYKAQQANLPQTGNSKNDEAIAVAGLGILAATTFTTMFGVAKKRHN
ncbi:SEC10/PgrA surface exclusion domain-containing protein [Limosilactobacillus reuteri]|uniref:SEC10/PgrA surface exclusion domain-containing protein n=1 Tax=Limosilactobacillus reuteri TaxID=1598 RepID=UPI0017853237|nr:SEC10/PgrA surface exclusion domain-containing protein [Limosilactobacillus reuteri]